MKELLICFLLGFIVQLSYAQKIGFIPGKLPGVAEKDYNKGKYILENTYKSMEEHGDTVYADYWNIAVGYSYMDYDKNEILELLKKSKEEDAESFCIIAQFKNSSKPEGYKSSKFYKLLGADFENLIKDCEHDGTLKPFESSLKEKSYYKGLNYDLIAQLDRMMLKDQKYRRDNDVLTNKKKWEKQKALDMENQIELANIFEKYGYPGKSLVGSDFDSNACLILEHGSDLAFQEKWFPTVIEAMRKGEADINIVRMLIDRIYWKKTGKQIFGSHVDVPMEEEKIIREIQAEYGL
ncbi:MAG TPA: hypothetical protein ENJ95_11500 [Bacteroidetes bacterium]|nr:hypothetical protein [Bacteroidota bacterium]